MKKTSYTVQMIADVGGMLATIMPSEKAISFADVVKKNEKQMRGAIGRGVTLPEIVKNMNDLGVSATLSSLRSNLRALKPKKPNKTNNANEWN